MNKLIPKPDGTIEFGMSGCCCPPGEGDRPGWHTNACTDWVRVNSGKWIRLDGFDRTHRRQDIYALAEAADTVSEFVLALPELFFTKTT
jgi:hypothetical protein